MSTIYNDIIHNKQRGQKLLAVLLDPDKILLEEIPNVIEKINYSMVTHIFVGGSDVEPDKTHQLVALVKSKTVLPVILFPGDIAQLTNAADALLLLSLISGRNPDYIIGKHVEAIPFLKSSSLEIISTAYLLIENGKKTSVEQVSKTQPLKRSNTDAIVNTALAGEYLGLKLIYLEAGSGATHPIDAHIIQTLRHETTLPIIVGGGIRSFEALQNAYNAGADMVVIGTAFEQNISFLDEIKQYNERIS
ncbi:MAG: geranylgeranylglyceryl/heptaprenylglyceryl phosphate synthase [Winogradskyella sp.]|nr:geranylgeranylglyceryl/heptaprenylglyceryl phosphate synthase [Winogradskyella sp.]